MYDHGELATERAEIDVDGKLIRESISTPI